MTRGAIVLVALLLVQGDRSGVLESTYVAGAIPLDPTPARPEWTEAQPVLIDRDYLSQPIPGRPTEVRSRWTREHLYVLFSCPFETLRLIPAPDVVNETPQLWNWEVAEVFIGWDARTITQYKELQVSPQGEWVDLAIDRASPATQPGMRWNSGVTVAARIDPAARVWYGLMRIPWAAIDTRTPQPGRQLRLGLFRIAGAEPDRRYYAWRPTGRTSFHVPDAFGTLLLR